jgi:hypothetical protein
MWWILAPSKPGLLVQGDWLYHWGLPDDTPSSDVVDRIWSHLGGSAEALQKIKFGSGAVGKLAVIAVAAVLAISFATTRTTPAGALIGILAIVFLVLCTIAATLYVVATKPELAVLEGMQVVRYKQLTLGAKGYSPETESLPIPDPKVLLIPPTEEEKQSKEEEQ